MNFIRRVLVAALAALCLIAYPALPQATRAYMAYMGPFSPSTTYNVNDVAVSGGVSYVSLQPLNINNSPVSSPAYWSVLADRGVLIPYGNLLNQTSWSSLTGYTANGTTPTVGGGAVVFSGGAGTYTQSLDWNYYTTLPQWSISGTLVAGAATSTSYGLGLGTRSYQANGLFYEVEASVDQTSAASRGKLYISNGVVAIATSAAQLSFSAGDTLKLSLTRNQDLMTATVSDLTTGSAAVSTTYQYQFAYPASALTPNLGKFAVYNLGGTQTLTSLSISSIVPIHADVLAVGDSKTAGYYAGSWANIWATQLQNNVRTFALAGGSDQTPDVLNDLPEIIALQPSAVVLNIGRNDLCATGGISLATTEANYASIVSQLQAASITVYHLLPLYEPTSACNQTVFSAWISATYPSAYLIDSGMENYAGTASNVLAPDSVHPNLFSEGLIYNAVVAKLASNGSRMNFTPYSVLALPENYVDTYPGSNNFTLATTGGGASYANYIAAMPSGTTGSVGFATQIGGTTYFAYGHQYGSTTLCVAYDYTSSTCALSVVPGANGALTLRNLTTQSMVSNNAASAAAGTNIGSGGTASCFNGDSGTCTSLAGLVQVTTGSSPAAGQMAVLSWASANRTVARCTVNGNSSAAAALLLPYAQNQTTTGINIYVANAPAASTTYYFMYTCGN